jgi:alpha-tubulin suppressor-like RCC1 family protein
MRSFAIRFFLLLCLICPALASAVTPMVAAGYAHTVALKSDGTVWAWGDNSWGQLGIGTNTTGRLLPVKVLTGAVAVAAGEINSVALKSDGTVWAWGANGYGQLGDGTTTDRSNPKAVKGLTGMIAVAAVSNHTVALKSDGTVWAWGDNSSGQLGDGTTTNHLTPIAVPGLAGVKAIAVGPSGYYTVALKSDGTVWAWGDNFYGQLGNGTNSWSLSPVAVVGLSGVISVVAGDFHTVALKSDGTVWAWGYNGEGELGDGTTTDSSSPVAVPGLTGVIAVAAGDAHTVALKSDGTVVAWGYNGDGELGDGTTTDSSSPVAVRGLVNVVAVAAGYYHTEAVRIDGTVVGWGYNVDGELGDGTMTNRLSPVEAYGLISAVACNTTSAVNMVNTCVPEVKLYVAGSSALGGALATVIPADLFDTTTTPVISVLDNGSANGNAGANAVSAWYGMSKAGLTGGASKRLFVVYNNNNGSAAGVSQLLVTENPAKTALIPEADVVTIGPAMTIAHNYAADSCAVDSASTALAPIIACTSHGVTQADMAISDVNVTELYQLESPSTGKLAMLSTLTTTPLALQGFGVAVNANLYAALQDQNIADGLLPGSCAGDATAACQPSIRRADYTSLVIKGGAINSAAALLPGVPAAAGQMLTLARGNDLSGTLAASNIFFVGNPCGRDHDSKGKLIKGVVGGMLDIVSTTDSTANLVIQANATANDVVTALNATGGYALGVLGLGIVPGGSDTWKFVKLDGVSPNFDADGSTDANQRNAFIRGDYPFAMTYYAVTPVKPAKTSTVTTTGYAVVSTLINGLKDSTLHDLTGIAYLNGADATKVSKVHRTNGNNCSPLIM